MLLEASVREFERSPIGRYTCTANCIVWSATSSLVGWRAWGRPDETEARTILNLLAQYPKLASSFDVIADTQGIEVANPPAIAALVPWVMQHRKELRRRVHMQVNVIRRDSIGYMLVGIIASLGDIHPFTTFTDAVEGFRSVAGDAGITLCEEIDSIVKRVRGLPEELVVLQTMLAGNLDTRIEDAAKALSTSERSLQRVLQQHGTSFHDEQTNARFVTAKSLLEASDEKIASVARRVGWSERTLTSIFRSRTGLTPTDWRKRSPTL